MTPLTIKWRARIGGILLITYRMFLVDRTLSELSLLELYYMEPQDIVHQLSEATPASLVVLISPVERNSTGFQCNTLIYVNWAGF